MFASEAKIFQREADRLKARSRAAEKRASWLKNYMKACLGRVGLVKLKTTLFSVRIQNNGRPSIDLAEGASIPKPYLRTREEFDSEAAYQDWKAKKKLPPELIVTLGSHLRIR
jgi:hypothetical protein